MALMVWSEPVDETLPYPWSTVPCPGCGETELAMAFRRPTTDFVCMACGTITKICGTCLNEGHVCEDHPDRAWRDGDGCCGAAGMPCPACCDPIPMDCSVSIVAAFTPRHLR